MKFSSRFVVLILLLLCAETSSARPIDALIDQISEIATQRTVKFDFTQRVMNGDSEIVGTGRGVCQAPAARMDIRVRTPNGEIETTIVTDGEHLWHIVDAGDKTPRRVVVYDLSSPVDEEASLDPFLALGGIRTAAFARLAGDRLAVAPTDAASTSLRIQLTGGGSAEGSAHFELDRSDLFPRSMHVFDSQGSVVAVVDASNVRNGNPWADSTFVYTRHEEDLVVRAGEQSSTPRLESGLEGRQAPPFALPDLSGAIVSLQSLRGKHLLIDFWATWCPPCRMAMPHIQALSQESERLAVVTISTDPPDVARRFLQTNGYTFPTLIDHDHSASRAYGITGIPTTFIIGPDGKVLRHLVGYHSESQLRSALREAGVPE